MTNEIISRIIIYLNDEVNSKWATSKTLINKLNFHDFDPLELDDILVKYFQKSEDSEIRFSTLPSKSSLDVLWGSVKRIKERNVIDIYNQNEQILLEELERAKSKNMFLSHSFKDSKIVIELAKKLIEYDMFCWLAEVEILKHGHINKSVKDAISQLPYFCVFISENLEKSVWSAKEIEFAMRNEKEIIGILYTENLDFITRIQESSSSEGTKISQEIYRRFFDNNPKVKFLFYPESSKASGSTNINQDSIIGWDYFENYT